jgi:hypothetical protein
MEHSCASSIEPGKMVNLGELTGVSLLGVEFDVPANKIAEHLPAVLLPRILRLW